ncbi:hypothetical protein C446_17409 [Halobiforma nitratireducens JCM 10879]|uniref:Uncharacterized protein n=1 Tax=Halobiforma nitratireducens JCM 10879 TaxID=1227454 RepID=M0L8A4_9EURY|nr:hypothetical protein C446_17409 [Halobiforma nitratireducens JCM 10879]
MASSTPSRNRDAYYQQLNHYQLGTEPVVETPEISDSALIWLDQDISVSLGEETTAQLNETLSSHGVLDALEESSAGGEDLQRSVQQALTDHDIDTASVGDAIGTTLLEAVGPLEINYRQGGQTSSTTAPGTGSPLGETADARLQLFADLYEETTPEGFQRAVVHHLRCQIRDCYVRCGIAPPEDVRIQGPGFYENVSWYEPLGFYEPYNDPRQTVDTWLEEHTPDDLLV